MVERSLKFVEEYGPIILEGFTFEGGYTDIVQAGDGDFITEDTLWDFKVTSGGWGFALYIRSLKKLNTLGYIIRV